MSQRFGFQYPAQGHSLGSCGSCWAPTFHIFFHEQSLSPLDTERRIGPFTQLLAEFKPDPPFITPLPPSIHLSPQTTNHWHVWGVCTRSILSTLPSFLCVSHPSRTSVSYEGSSCRLSLCSCFPLTLPLHPFFLSCLRVVSCDQSGGNNSVRMWWANHIRLQEKGWGGHQKCECAAVSYVPNRAAAAPVNT